MPANLSGTREGTNDFGSIPRPDSQPSHAIDGGIPGSLIVDASPFCHTGLVKTLASPPKPLDLWGDVPPLDGALNICRVC